MSNQQEIKNKQIHVLLLGRSNVGKSSLINRLTKKHVAVVSDIENTTLDLQYIHINFPEGDCFLVDSAGWFDGSDLLLKAAMNKLRQAISEVDLIWFVVDGRVAPNPLEWAIRDVLVKSGKKVQLIINKMDNPSLSLDSDIWKLGFADMINVSAKSGYQVSMLINFMRDALLSSDNNLHYRNVIADKTRRITLMGKPNSGKSTLFNLWVGEDLQIISDFAGTTRDSHEYPIICGGQEMVLVDTAGLRKNSKRDGLEYIFSQHTERSVFDSDIVVVMIRFDEALTDQDRRLLSFAYNKARSMVILLSQCDRVARSFYDKKFEELEYILSMYYPNVDIVSFDYKTKNFKNLNKAVLRASKSLDLDLSSSKLTRILISLVDQVPPPCTAVSRIKPRFCHPVKHINTIVVQGKQVESLPDSYKRYLVKGFVKSLGFINRPLHIIFQNDNNPYADN